MNRIVYTSLLLSVTSSFYMTEVKASEEKSSSAQEYIYKTYLSPTKEASSFQNVYGDPLTAQGVLLVFTSLTCPVCTEFHTSVLPALEKDVLQNSNFAIVIRDYPADPLSLKASSIVWANGDSKAKILEDKIWSSQMKWIQNTEEKSLENLVKMIKDSSLTPEENKSAQQACSDTAFLQKIFDRRNKDKEALNITQVPTAWLVVKNKKEPGGIEMIEITDLKDLKAIQSLVQEKVSSSSHTH